LKSVPVNVGASSIASAYILALALAPVSALFDVNSIYALTIVEPSGIDIPLNRSPTLSSELRSNSLSIFQVEHKLLPLLTGQIYQHGH